MCLKIIWELVTNVKCHLCAQMFYCFSKPKRLRGGLKTTLWKTLLYNVIIAEWGNAHGATGAPTRRIQPCLGSQGLIWLTGAGNSSGYRQK